MTIDRRDNAARYARLIAENRCIACQKVREPGDTETRRCPLCRAKRNARDVPAQRAKRHAKQLPNFNRKPGQAFRFGKTRLDKPRPVVLELDEETYLHIKLCRQHYVFSPAYEPYQVGEVIRRLLSLLADAPGPIPAAPQGRMRRGERCGLRLNFRCDKANYDRIAAHQKECGCTLSAAVRTCIQHATNYALTLPDEEAKRRLWPGYAELAE